MVCFRLVEGTKKPPAHLGHAVRLFLKLGLQHCAKPSGTVCPVAKVKVGKVEGACHNGEQDSKTTRNCKANSVFRADFLHGPAGRKVSGGRVDTIGAWWLVGGVDGGWQVKGGKEGRNRTGEPLLGNRRGWAGTV